MVVVGGGAWWEMVVGSAWLGMVVGGGYWWIVVDGSIV